MMKKKRMVGVLTILLSLCFSISLFAQTIILKTGEKIEGKIIERTDDYIIIDLNGAPTPYYFGEIESTEEELPDLKPKKELEENKEIFYDFDLGSHDVDENIIEFLFPGNMDTLYLFNLKGWKGKRSDSAKLRVDLYDEDHGLISSGKSVCVTKDIPSFGSMFFDGISKETVKDVAYFSMSVEDCGQQKQATSKSDFGYTSAKGQLEKIYRDYLNALDNRSMEDMRKYMLVEYAEEIEAMAAGLGSMNNAFSMLSTTSPRNLENIEEWIKGDEAVLSATSPAAFAGEAKSTITFGKEDGAWKIKKVLTEY